MAETVLRRDRIIVLAGLIGIIVLAWIYLLWDAAQMMPAPMDMSMPMDMPMPQAVAPPSLLIKFSTAFAMWALMMAGMMLPSAAPTILLYAGIARKNRQQQQIFPATSIFVTGYLLCWTAFSAAAAILQVILSEMALLSPMLVSVNAVMSGALLTVAGVYQWLPIKDKCLQICRSPLAFVTMRWRPGNLGAFRMGLENGVFCVGCCWPLMLLLFVAGVMNLLWVAVITAFIFIEKLLPHGKLTSRFAGIGLISFGIWMLALV